MPEGTRQPLVRSRILILIGTLALVALAGAIVGGYLFGWEWTGVNTREKDDTVEPAKTLWDWMSLLIVPLVLAIGGYMYNNTEKQRDQEQATVEKQRDEARTKEDNREAALQAYLDRMADLFIKQKLGEQDENAKARQVARAHTLTALTRLDPKRKASVLQFLYESELIHKDNRIVNLEGADLSSADLRGANLNGANLRRARLSGADLSSADLPRADLSSADLRGANLNGANLNGADLSGALLFSAEMPGADLRGAVLRGARLTGAILNNADLSSADLSGAFLTGANLTGATVTNEQLATCAYLNGATLPDRT